MTHKPSVEAGTLGGIRTHDTNPDITSSNTSVVGGDQQSLGISIDNQDVGAERRRVQREAEEQRDWILEARRVAAGFALEHGIVTSDEVHKLCPKPDHVHDNTWGSILSRPWFWRGSEVYSWRRLAKKRTIHYWHLTAQGRELL